MRHPRGRSKISRSSRTPKGSEQTRRKRNKNKNVGLVRMVALLGGCTLFFAVHVIIEKTTPTDSWISEESQSGQFQQSEEPTHVKICRNLVNKVPQHETIMEDAAVCLNDVAPTWSLSQIFLSTLLAETSRMHGSSISYEHGCNRLRKEKSLIQEFLPSPLLIPDDQISGLISQQGLTDLCRAIVLDANSGGFIDAKVALLGSPVELIRQAQATQQKEQNRPPNNMDQHGYESSTPALRFGKQKEVTLLERSSHIVHKNIRAALAEASKVANAVKTNKGILSFKGEHDIIYETAAIQLPCEDPFCQDLMILPDYAYLEHLPRSLRSIDVFVVEACTTNLFQCSAYANGLVTTLQNFFPRASVDLIVAKPSSMNAMARLIHAEHVLCGPGFGLGCLFPSIMRSSMKDNKFTQGRFTLLDSFGPDSMASAGANMSSLRTLLHTPSTSDIPLKSLTTFGLEPGKVENFRRIPPDRSSGKCRHLRGRTGSWVQDMEYAALAQYRTPLHHYSGHAERNFRERKSNWSYDYRPSTTYKWTENIYPTCEASLISRGKVCELLQAANIGRLFILGDSLNLQFVQSLFMMLSTEGDSPTPRDTKEPNFRHRLTCPSTNSQEVNQFEYVLQFVRNDELLENGKSVSIDKDISNCESFCYPWTEAYLSDPGRTVVIANAGAHIHKEEKFREAFDRFVETIDRLNRPNDIVLFRTLAPGHWSCDRPGLLPYKNFNEYLDETKRLANERKEALYSWSLFAKYNDYASRVLDIRNNNLSANTQYGRIEILDIFPITVLRPDGHASDEFRPDHYPTTDCLHYSLPGPVDWWSHLAFSHINDIVVSHSGEQGRL